MLRYLHFIFYLFFSQVKEIWLVNSQESIKIVAIRCHILRLKCSNKLSAGLCPTPRWGAYSIPRPSIAAFQRSTSKVW